MAGPPRILTQTATLSPNRKTDLMPESSTGGTASPSYGTNPRRRNKGDTPDSASSSGVAGGGVEPNFKVPRLRDKKWRDYLNAQPCRRCGRAPSDAAHLGHSDTSLKPPDDQCVSLCRPCHNEMDTAMEGKGEWWVNQILIPEEQVKYRAWRGALAEWL